ncbi:MAG: hypothetical protein JOY60_13010 [Burkholderiaceae bacterium]|nr:hypothetical protein [Burkholderiaceae bacterium]
MSSLLLLPFLLVTGSRQFHIDEAFATRCLVSAAYLQFALYCLGFLLAPYPYDYMYFFMGSFICLIYGLTMLRLRARAVLVLGALALLTALPVFMLNLELKDAALNSPAARIYVWPALSFLLTAATMGYVVSNLLEHSERDSFARAHELERQNAIMLRYGQEVAQLNQTLRYSSDQAQQKALALIELKERMRLDAERRNREKSQFLASAVHDLKQPIQAISNVLEPGRRALERKDNGTAMRMFDLAAEASDLMRRLLAGVLEISRLESGFVHAELSSFNVLPMIQDILNQARDQALREGVLLRGPAPGKVLFVHSDEHLLTRILLNLVGNGIKYHDPTRHERIVQLKLQPTHTCLRLTVEDNGIGMDPELVRSEAIFKPFFQIANSRRESEKGVGLGLSIVRAMLSLLPRHLIEILSSPGQGTRITLELPWGQPHAPGSHASEDAGRAGTRDELTDWRGIYVLYVEDDELVRRTSCAIFDSYGLRYESAASLSELNNLLATMERRPDLLVSDYRLPDGKTAADVVQALDAVFGTTPTLVLTGEGWTDKLMDPAWTVRVKPISTAQLLTTIQELLHRSVSV